MGIPIIQVSSAWLRQLLQSAGKADPAPVRDAAASPDAAAKALQAAADKEAQPGEDWPLTVAGKVVVEDRLAKLHNVAAVLPGWGELAKEWVIVGAHYDHIGRGPAYTRGPKGPIYFGADDNASGTAGMLVRARNLARQAGDPFMRPAAQRSILFAAFTAEETGLIGANYMCEHLAELGLSHDKVSVMVNLDMIGRLREKKLEIWGVDSGEGLRALVSAAAARSDLKISMSGLGSGPGDFACFYARKIPVLSFHTGIHAEYHTIKDTADLINVEGSVQVLGLAEVILADLLTQGKPIAYLPPKKGLPPGRGSGAYLGVRPGEGEGGCRLSDVVAEGPAAEAGLLADDLIVGWNNSKIGGTDDLLAAVAASKPGEEVLVTVRRAGKELVMKVKLGKL